MFGKRPKTMTMIAGLLLFTSSLVAQNDSIPVRDEKVHQPVTDLVHRLDFGLGLGIDYGGLLGIQAGIAPVKRLTLFGAIGYYMFQAGWNVGIKGLLFPKTATHTFRPFLKAAYGSNSVITAEGTDEYDKVYHGFTVGLGMELRFGKKKKNGFDIDLNVPLRTGDFWADFNKMKNDPNLEVLQGPIPVAFSIGFHHEL